MNQRSRFELAEGIGARMYKWASDLFPICRSLTGDGVRETLEYFKRILPEMRIVEVPTGTKAFDWTVPNEWNIHDAYVMNMKGNKIIDFNDNNLHVVGYSVPVDRVMLFSELDQYLYSIPEQPNAIPYVTSYYDERWGFCLSETQRNELRKSPNRKYRVKIDSELKPGGMTYGELKIPGRTNKEIIISTYVCHPSMANNELSGPCVATALALWLKLLTRRYFTYRILFLVETIGAIVYLDRHLEELQKNTEAGFVVTCVGDDRTYSYVQSRYANTISEKVLSHVLKYCVPTYDVYSYLERGSDERQYGSPGVDLPMCTVCRSKFGEYPEYHTSLDNLSLITEAGLFGAFDVLKRTLGILEKNVIYKNTVFCEPQLGRRNLYPTISYKGSATVVKNLMNFLAYADGTNDLLDIAELLEIYVDDLSDIVYTLLDHGLIETA